MSYIITQSSIYIFDNFTLLSAHVSTCIFTLPLLLEINLCVADMLKICFWYKTLHLRKIYSLYCTYLFLGFASFPQ